MGELSRRRRMAARLWGAFQSTIELEKEINNMNQPTTRPGIRTTEFLLALAVTVLGAVAAIYAESQAAQVAGMVGATLASTGYGFARTQVKRTVAVVEAGAAERADVLAAQATREPRPIVVNNN